MRCSRSIASWVLHPVARVFGAAVQEPARISLSRFLQNAGVLPRFANDLFQGQFEQAGVETERFAINTTLGVAGLFDPASRWLGLKQEHGFSAQQTSSRIPSTPTMRFKTPICNAARKTGATRPFRA
jgi:ABC-type transporter lipoprotein component MlaA